MPVQLYAYTGGFVTIPSNFLLTGTKGVITAPVPAYLIVHDKGRALFDSGLPIDSQTDPAAPPSCAGPIRNSGRPCRKRPSGWDCPAAQFRTRGTFPWTN